MEDSPGAVAFFGLELDFNVVLPFEECSRDLVFLVDERLLPAVVGTVFCGNLLTVCQNVE